MQVVKGRVADIITEGFTWGDRRTGSASQFATIQLFNPAGSGVTLFVRSLVVDVELTQLFYIARHNTQVGTGVAGINLRSGGSAGKGEVSSTSEATQLGNIIVLMGMLAMSPFVFPPAFGFVLPESTGLIVVANTSGQFLSAFFVWGEKAT